MRRDRMSAVASPAMTRATGEAYLSHTVLDGRYVLRLAVGHHRTTEDDVRCAWELLQEG